MNNADLGSAPASSSNSTSDDPASQSDLDSSFTKRTALCKGVSASRRSIGSTSRPSWSRSRSNTSSITGINAAAPLYHLRG